MTSADYRVRVLPEAHEVEVELSLTGLPAGPIRLRTPTWVPGAYGFMKYGRDLFDVKAFDPASGRELHLVREGWSGFRVEGASGALRVGFKAYAFDPAWGELVGLIGHDQALLLATHFLFAPAHSGPCRVEYLLPEGWDLHHPSGARRQGERTWEYPSFAVLLDTPIVAGRFERRTRTIAGTPFHFVFLDEALGMKARVEAFIGALERIAEGCRALFGGFPFEDYSFLFTFDPQAHWGLEHANATTIALSDELFIDDDAWAQGLRVCAHELFHAWNVCRLKPAPLGAPDLEGGSFPDALWVSEGITRYYEFLLLVRARAITGQDFFANVVNYYRQLESHPAFRRVSLLDSSRATFLNHNKYPGSINATIDYYDKGMLVAFDLDVALRAAGSQSGRPDRLDAALAELYRTHVGRGDGLRHDEAKAFFAQRLPQARELLEREVERPGELGVIASLRALGFEVEERPVPRLGLVFSEKTPAQIANVADDSPAGRSGIAPLDVVERVNGFPFKPKALAWATASEPTVALQVKRGARSLVFSIAPEPRSQIASLVWRGTEDQLARIRSWLERPDFDPRPGEAFSLAPF
ncbi:MAG: M61 family metallopeptidase, partial [Deltaproteobacteria bacterium]|nr:M61 family metallopeptidase [Deltaproteobacteria bacterium]